MTLDGLLSSFPYKSRIPLNKAFSCEYTCRSFLQGRLQFVAYQSSRRKESKKKRDQVKCFCWQQGDAQRLTRTIGIRSDQAFPTATPGSSQLVLKGILGSPRVLKCAASPGYLFDWAPNAGAVTLSGLVRLTLPAGHNHDTRRSPTLTVPAYGPILGT